MNLLLDKLPKSLMVGGQKHKINADFRTGLRIMAAYENGELTHVEKAQISFHNLYREPRPPMTEEAMQQVTWFLNGGEESNDGESGNQKRVFGFSHDHSLIFSAFQQTHGINLRKAVLHWWEFMSLFSDLGSETGFANIVGLRKRIQDGDASKEDHALAARLGERFEIPDDGLNLDIDGEDNANKFFELLGVGNG